MGLLNARGIRPGLSTAQQAHKRQSAAVFAGAVKATDGNDATSPQIGVVLNRTPVPLVAFGCSRRLQVLVEFRAECGPITM